MAVHPHHDLPDSAFEPASRALIVWTGARERFVSSGATKTAAYLLYGAVLAVALCVGFGAATFATAPSMTYGVDDVATIAAVDARGMGMALNLDPGGRQAKADELGRDVGAMKREVARLKRALDQAKAGQAALSKSVAGQDDVKALKAEIAGLQKSLETTREAAQARIEALTAKLDQPKPGDDAAKLADLRERLERVESRAPAKDASAKDGSGKDVVMTAVPGPQPKAEPKTPTESRTPAEPETTGSVASAPSGVVRNWTVRDVYDGVALLDGRQGLVEVTEGARLPGVGRVTAIERRDRQWVVVTDRGVILQRQ